MEEQEPIPPFVMMWVGFVCGLLHCGFVDCSAGESRAERFQVRSVSLFLLTGRAICCRLQMTKILILVLYLFNGRVGEISGDYIVGGIRTPMTLSQNKVVQMPPK